MFGRRLIVVSMLFMSTMAVCLLRLWHLQYAKSEQARQNISRLAELPARPLSTLRGRIIDRTEKTLAANTPVFYLCLNYRLCRLMDNRYWQAKTQQLEKNNPGMTAPQIEQELAKSHAEQTARLQGMLDFCWQTQDFNQDELEKQIQTVNDQIWELAQRIAWRRANPQQPWSHYAVQKDQMTELDVLSADIAEMRDSFPVYELKSRQDLMDAQLEFLDSNDVFIRSVDKRVYPCASAGSQIIGWVGPVRDEEEDLFGEDDYLQYLQGELIGKTGAEKYCEILLRGRRGQVIYDRQDNIVSRTEPLFGSDIQLTIDIALQRQLEDLLNEPKLSIAHGELAAAIIDVATGDILAAASSPGFDLNQARQKYDSLLRDSRMPLTNKALENNYPAGSTIKPLILIAGVEEGKINPADVIACTYELPPAGWPKCLLQRLGYCHDSRWAEENQVNNGRNAIRGSCNVYFSRLADRLDPEKLQHWLWRFGFGRDVLMPCIDPQKIAAMQLPVPVKTAFRQAHGSIVFGSQANPFDIFADVPAIPENEKRWWGIGQGNLRVTVLQVANAYAALARKGVWKPARIVSDPDDPLNEKHNQTLPIRLSTLAVVYDGMHAVVNEQGGSGYEALLASGLKNTDLKIYGKTGSTERPDNAWFAAFITDNAGRALSLALVVEGGQRGSSDAAPLAMKIITLCRNEGYIGSKINPTTK